MDVTKMTREALKDIPLGQKEKDRAKNMFVLGFLYWMYNRDMENTEKFLQEKFSKKAEILESNLKVLKAGYAYGETTDTFTTTYTVSKATMPSGTYRSVMGNQALAYGLIAASQQSGLPLFWDRIPLLRLLIFYTSSVGIKILAYEPFRRKMRSQPLPLQSVQPMEARWALPLRVVRVLP